MLKLKIASAILAALCMSAVTAGAAGVFPSQGDDGGLSARVSSKKSWEATQ